MRQTQKRDSVGRFTESARLNRKIAFTRFRQLFRIAFGVVFVLLPVFMAAVQNPSTMTFENDSVAVPAVIERVQAAEREPVNIERLLHAVCIVESQCTHDRIGDNGRSFGAFQINFDAHKNVTIEQAFNFEWSRAWTLNHCKRYSDDVRMFAKCHNGIGKTTNNWYMDRVEREYNKLSK